MVAKPTIATGAFLLLALGGCSAATRDEKLCKANIRESLINPETAQFFEFAPIDVQAFRAGVENWAWKDHDVSKSDRYKFGDQLKEAIDDTVRAATADEAKTYSFRIKAESKIGLTVTSSYVCAAKKDECACLSSEE